MESHYKGLLMNTSSTAGRYWQGSKRPADITSYCHHVKTWTIKSWPYEYLIQSTRGTPPPPSVFSPGEEQIAHKRRRFSVAEPLWGRSILGRTGKSDVRQCLDWLCQDVRQCLDWLCQDVSLTSYDWWPGRRCGETCPRNISWSAHSALQHNTEHCLEKTVPHREVSRIAQRLCSFLCWMVFILVTSDYSVNRARLRLYTVPCPQLTITSHYAVARMRRTKSQFTLNTKNKLSHNGSEHPP